MHTDYNGPYTDENLNHVAFPMGGIGAGMMCLEGTGALSHVSVRGEPNVHNEPLMFAALGIKGRPDLARVLQGPVPEWKIFTTPEAGNGLGGTSYGLPRFDSATFRARFPFGTVSLADPNIPLTVEITGWSPFVPGDADSSSLPVAALEFVLQPRRRSSRGTASSRSTPATLWSWAKDRERSPQHQEWLRPLAAGQRGQAVAAGRLQRHGR